MPRANRLSRRPSARACKFIVQLPGADTVIGEDGGTFSVVKTWLLMHRTRHAHRPGDFAAGQGDLGIDTRTELQVQAAFDGSWLAAQALSWRIAEHHPQRRLHFGDARRPDYRARHARQLLAAGGFYAELYRSQFAQ